MLHLKFTAGVPIENILYLGGPNIASEIYNREYANARICGAEKWRKALAKFLRHPHFIVWDNGDLVTHEVMGGLKNVYAIGAGIILSLFWCKVLRRLLSVNFFTVHILSRIGFLSCVWA